MQSNPPSATVTADEARARTDEIKRAPGEELWAKLLLAFERRAWASLGYTTWSDFAQAEFDMRAAAGRLALKLHDTYKPGRIV